MKTMTTKTTLHTNGTKPHDAQGAHDEGERHEGKPKQADILIELAKARATFFAGRGDSQLYASVEVGDHRECLRMKSDRFNDWLSFLFFTEHKTTLNAQARQDAKSILAFEARNQIEDVFIRVGHANGKVYLDMGTPDHEAIEVDENGWRIIPVPPVHFRRSEHMLPLACPVQHLDPLILNRYVNIEESDWPLLAAWCVAALHPHGPYPILALLSRAGSGKSTLLRVLKRIIDPSSAEVRSPPNDVRDLFIAASNSWFLAFDNVSRLSPEVADALCVISTGGGFTKKANYTDGEEHVINVQRPMAINGIGDVITRQDLMDRSLPLSTPFLSESDRKSEDDFWQAFNQDRPKILGAFLYALSTGLKNIGSVVLEKKPRMADFAKIAISAESAYTDTRHSFLETYADNRDEAAATIVENSPVGEVLRRLVLVTGTLKKTPTELFEMMNAAAKDYERDARGWPTAPNQIKTIVDRIAPALASAGVEVEYKKNHGVRVFSIKRML